MTEVLISPDIETATVTFLRSGLGALAAKVATNVPATMPITMVKVSLTGGARVDVATDLTQLTIECWAQDSLTASLLARKAYALMLSAAGADAGGIWVRRAETLGGVQFFPDPDTTKPRYQFTVRWAVRPVSI